MAIDMCTLFKAAIRRSLRHAVDGGRPLTQLANAASARHAAGSPFSSVGRAGAKATGSGNRATGSAVRVCEYARPARTR